MAATIVSSFTYPLTDFTSLGGNSVNPNILKQEIEDDATITLTVSSVTKVGSTVKIDLEGNATAAMKTALDSVVAAHEGGNFAVFPQKVSDEDAESDDTGSEVQKASLSTGLMPAGDYRIGWYMEVETTSESSGATQAQGHFNVSKNGGSSSERGQTNAEHPRWVSMGGTYEGTFVDGDELDLELTYQRVGTSGNAARAQRARITVTRVG